MRVRVRVRYRIRVRARYRTRVRVRVRVSATGNRTMLGTCGCLPMMPFWSKALYLG